MRLINALVAAILVAFALVAYPAAQAPNASRTVAGQILVKFQPGAAAAAKAEAHRQGGGRVLNEIASTGVQLVAVAAGEPEVGHLDAAIGAEDAQHIVLGERYAAGNFGDDAVREGK